MKSSMSPDFPVNSSRVWGVGALCRAIADALDARFNPVSVRGEISGFSRAVSGHCYFSLKDATGQIRCAMFKRAAGMLDFSPKDGELVEVQGRLGVYEARGDLQLVVESMRKAGQGALFEQFLRLKGQLEAEGLFAVERKRPLPWMPRRIGVVTSPGAAAWHDVMTALQRRAPHIPVILSPSAVQGTGAAATLVHALEQLYVMARGDSPVDVILLVRGGGSMEDLWCFNDERLARTLIQSPVPIISGVGHETDFTIADFVADVRAPTPTAAAEMASQPQQTWLQALDILQDRLQSAAFAHIDRQSQRVSALTAHLGRPSARIAQHRMVLSQWGQQLQFSRVHALREHQMVWQRNADRLPFAVQRALQCQTDKLSRAHMRLEMLDPQRVLERGFAWLSDHHGLPVTRVEQVAQGQSLVATLADGQLPVTVSGQPLKP